MKIKKINLKSDILLKLAFLLFGLIPLSSQKLEPIIGIFFILLILLELILNKQKKVFKTKKPYILNALLFLVLLITLKDGIGISLFKKLEQMFSLFIFPIAFYILSKEGYFKNRMFFNIWKKTFVFSTFILALICFFLISKYVNPKYLELDSNFFQNAISDDSYFSRHPAYVSIYLNVSILICVNWFFETRNKRYKALYFLIVLTLSSLLLMLSVKIAIIALIISVNVLLFLKIKSKKIFLISQLLIISVFLIIISIPKDYNRFSKIFNSNVLNENTRYNSIFIHKQTILCATKIFKDNFIFGVGIENSTNNVNECVREVFLFDKQIVYNSHNQYLSYGLHSGFLGVFVLCLALFFGLKKSLKQDSFLFTVYLYFCVVFLTENVLERQSGLLLFTFLINIIVNLRSFNPKFYMSK